MVAPQDIRSFPQGANAAKIADEVVAQWHAIESALAPILGSRGVAALYHRSCFLATRAHPWLSQGASGGSPMLDLAALRACVSVQDAAQAASGGSFLLRTFLELLTNLIGASLAERLLGPLWVHSSNGFSARDPLQ
jgi:hypothetical protein